MSTSVLYQSTLKRKLGPPWLQRIVGSKLMGAIGEVLDDHLVRLTDGLKLRFPGIGVDDDGALPYIGRDRLIRRGPSELAATYAARLRLWWDSHRTRGGPYALLHQLYEYFLADLNVRMDVVSQLGNRHWIDAAGVITHDQISWGGGGPTAAFGWAHVWVIFYLDHLYVRLVDEDGNPLVTDEGDYIVVDTLASGTIPESAAENFRVIPREWSAAHIPFITVVLLYGSVELWDYPVPVGQWDDPPGATWQTTDPIQIIAS